MSVRIKGVAAAAASVVFVVGCGSGPAASSAPPASGPPSVAPSAAPSNAPSAQPPSASPSAVAATVLLKVTTEGGFINPSANLNALPLVEVLSDGRILTPGAVDAIAPAPLLPTLEVRDTGAAGAAAITAAITQAGLDKPSTGGPGVPGDSGTDIFSVTIDGQTTDTRLAGGGGGPGVGGPGGHLPGDSGDPGRAAAFDLLTKLQDPTVAWGGGAVQPTPYAPAGYLVFVIPGAPQNDPATTQVPVAWPLSTTLDAFGSPAANDRGVAGLRQGAVLGADAATLGPILSKATVETAFTSGGSSFTLSVRPLLPDELGG
jgi:hypothetical protein